jgi:hypothetical protein
VIDNQLAHLLDIQGQLLDKFLEQNLGKRYFYCIVVSPTGEPAHVSAISNVANRDLVTPMLRELARTLTGVEPDEIVDLKLQGGVIVGGSHGNA